MDVILRPAAAADVEEAYSWYQRQRIGLGEEFLDTVNEAIRDIAAHPLRQAVIFRDTRRLLLRRFPYAVFYRVYPGVIVVVACMHGRRNPLRWLRRR
ncbi:MAG TPA: type II toxin-antitoxin system RelE/ParE family toxin [Casimicrobiaceae bacterium]|nr:type II toxin-antitoxin system RelE/ParE family toxin [Casimicrobiaceae bacterium]